jgi:hypothetical protein
MNEIVLCYKPTKWRRISPIEIQQADNLSDCSITFYPKNLIGAQYRLYGAIAGLSGRFIDRCYHSEEKAKEVLEERRIALMKSFT